MSCCHADFALVEGSDRGFTVGMPTFTFGAGVLAEAGDNARELGLRRVALFTDKRLATGEHVATIPLTTIGSSNIAAPGNQISTYVNFASNQIGLTSKSYSVANLQDWMLNRRGRRRHGSDNAGGFMTKD